MEAYTKENYKEWGQWFYVPSAAEMEGWDFSNILDFR